MDLVKLQMLRYIIYRFNQTFGNVLAQISIHYKGLIKYTKVDGIIPMNTHVQIAHLKLFVQRKQLNKKVAIHVAHVQQSLSILLCNY